MGIYHPKVIDCRSLTDVSGKQSEIENDASLSKDLVIIQTSQYIHLWQGKDHSLAWFVSEQDSQLQLSTHTPELTKSMSINTNAIDEIALFGFISSADTYIKQISRVIPEHWLSFQIDSFTVSNILEIPGNSVKDIALDQSFSRNLIDQQLTSQEWEQNADSTERTESDNFNDPTEQTIFQQLPEVARTMFSPVTSAFQPQLALTFESIAQTSNIELALDFSTPEKLLALNSPSLWKRSLDSKGKQRVATLTKQLKQRLKQKGQPNAQQDLRLRAWQDFGRHQVQHQIRCLAQTHGHTVTFCDSKQNIMSHEFLAISQPLTNLLESFQRLFYYGSSFFKELDIFIPPSISSVIVKKLTEHQKINQPEFCMFMLTLDYLMRFNHPHTYSLTGDNHERSN